MYIKEITIENFRQLRDVKLTLENGVTILAGPNNSGKTTLMNLLKRTLSEGTKSFSKEDISVVQLNNYYKKIIEISDEKLKESLDDNIKLVNFKKKLEEKKSSCIFPECKIKIQIEYSEEDDIRNFADYIMDLDSEKHSFYFLYKINLDMDKFKRNLEAEFYRLKNIYKKAEDIQKKLKERFFLKLYIDNLQENSYFTDVEYGNLEKLEISLFRKLFNFKIIEAEREIGDFNESKTKKLSKELISLASKNDEWKRLMDKLPEDVSAPFRDSEVPERIEENSVKALNDVIKKISSTNGGNTGKIGLSLDITEEGIREFLNEIICAKYLLDGYSLNETAQGLGYSNMILMHIKLENYFKTLDETLVNLFFIEEPESHMHPQMQHVFSRYLLECYEKKNIQGLVSTHSNEIVKSCNMENLRVIRKKEDFKSEIFDFNYFKKEIEDKRLKSEDENCNEESKDLLKNFYSFFFEIGFSEIVFADRVILYEGDTERLYLKKIISLNDFEELQKKYIAFIQVGGAYAYNFKNVIEFLKIKTLIITDIDYNCYPKNIIEIIDANSTNATIKNFYEDNNKGNSLKNIKELYKWIEASGNIVLKNKNDELIYLAIQTSKDNYTRTLEEAMLAKKFNIKAYEIKSREEWKELKKNSKLKFSIPKEKKDEEGEKEKDDIRLRNILDSTSKGKTNFMYSVILNNLALKMLPNYIERGLKWLMKK